jgi:hypothetical protein
MFRAEIGKFVKKLTTHHTSEEQPLEPKFKRAPIGTNQFLLQYEGTNIQEMGFETGRECLMVGKEQCKSGVCADVTYGKNLENGDRFFLHAHVRSDDTMEIGYATLEIQGNPHNKKDLDFNESLEIVKERLHQRGGEVFIGLPQSANSET